MNEIFELLKIILPSAVVSAIVSSSLDAVKERKRKRQRPTHYCISQKIWNASLKNAKIA